MHHGPSAIDVCAPTPPYRAGHWQRADLAATPGFTANRATSPVDRSAYSVRRPEMKSWLTRLTPSDLAALGREAGQVVATTDLRPVSEALLSAMHGRGSWIAAGFLAAGIRHPDQRSQRDPLAGSSSRHLSHGCRFAKGNCPHSSRRWVVQERGGHSHDHGLDQRGVTLVQGARRSSMPRRAYSARNSSTATWGTALGIPNGQTDPGMVAFEMNPAGSLSAETAMNPDKGGRECSGKATGLIDHDVPAVCRLVRAGFGVAAVLLLSSCSSGDHNNNAVPHPSNAAGIIVPGGAEPYSTAVQSVRQDTAWTFGSLMICAPAPSSRARINAVDVSARGHGLAIVGFATRPNPFLSQPPGQAVGSEKGTVADHHLRGTVVSRCLAPRQGTEGQLTAATELIVSVRRTGSETGATPGIVVHYQAGSKPGAANFPFGFTLCSPTDTKTHGCSK
jgi:hypothetical protein